MTTTYRSPDLQRPGHEPEAKEKALAEHVDRRPHG